MEHMEDDDVVLLSDTRVREENLQYLEAPDQPRVVNENTNYQIQDAPDELMHVSEDACNNPEVDGNIQPNSTEDLHPPVELRLTNYALKCAVVASITSGLLGVYVKVMSGGAVHIKQDRKTTEISMGALTGILNLFVILGSAMAGWTADLKGRRRTIVFGGAILFFATLFMRFAPSYAFFLIGNLFANIGVGYALMISPLYIAEVSPTFSRGCLTSFPEIFINCGIILGYIFNYVFSKLHLSIGWHVILSVGTTSLAILTIRVLHMPESPRWLIMEGRLLDAKHVLAKTYGSNEEAALRFTSIKEAAGIPPECNGDIVNVNRHSIWEVIWRDLLLHRTRSMCHILVCVIMIHFFHEAFAIDAVFLIFKTADITSSSDKLLMTLAVDLVKTISIPVATLLLDRVGRRPLLLFSTGGMIFSLTFLGTFLTIIDQRDTKLTWEVNMCIVSVLLHAFFFSVGLGPVTSVYSSEIFPLSIRAQGCAIGVIANQVVSIIISMTFFPLYQAITLGGTAFLLAAIAISAFLFVYKFMPETKGRTLEEMGLFFGEFTNWRSAAREIEMQGTATRPRQQ
ncbi:polyol transporter 5-like [Syzygium oleosum]|uniref:polyol transporter 5-like n=1 Tax=Syzygium oleosum TaxID=219896 RepID=UPI0011D1DF08|nr:polyol transporter 5-like [Syzygium oleosum]